jgi:hypothetical protein
MPRPANYDREALQGFLDRQYGVVARAQALGCELSNRVLQHRLRPGGPWQSLLPGVYLAAAGMPKPAQREMAALLYAGPASMITGPAALLRHGVPVAHTGVVDVLVPATTQRKDQQYVRLHRTARLPGQPHVRDEIRYAPAARAVADTARMMMGLNETRALVTDALQRGACTLEQLTDEVREGPIRGSAILRQALADVARQGPDEQGPDEQS